MKFLEITYFKGLHCKKHWYVQEHLAIHTHLTAPAMENGLNDKKRIVTAGRANPLAHIECALGSLLFHR